MTDLIQVFLAITVLIVLPALWWLDINRNGRVTR